MDTMRQAPSDAARQPREPRPEPVSSPRVTLMARLRSPGGLGALIIIVAIVALASRTLHSVTLFPLALILICPLMMWVMMRGMGGMGGGSTR